MGTAEVKAIIQNLYSGIEIREGRRMPTKITGQATLNRIYKPNDQYPHYRSDWYELVSTEPLTQVDSRVYNYDPNVIAISPVLIQRNYEDGTIVSSGQYTASGYLEYYPKELIEHNCVVESQVSIKADSSTITSAPFRIDNAGDAYRYVVRYEAPKHLTAGQIVVGINAQDTVTMNVLMSIYDDEHAPVDDNGELNGANYHTFNNVAFESGSPQELSTSSIVAAAAPYDDYITLKLGTNTAQTLNFTPSGTTIIYTPAKAYKSDLYISGNSLYSYNMSFTSDHAGTVYVNGTGNNVTVGTNLLALPATGSIVLDMTAMGDMTWSDVSLETDLVDNPYFLQFTNKQFIKDRYYYTMECRY